MYFGLYKGTSQVKNLSNTHTHTHTHKLAGAGTTHKRYIEAMTTKNPKRPSEDLAGAPGPSGDPKRPKTDMGPSSRTGCQFCKSNRSRDRTFVITYQKTTENTMQQLFEELDLLSHADLDGEGTVVIHTENTDIQQRVQEEVEDELMERGFREFGEHSERSPHDKNHVVLKLGLQRRYNLRGAFGYSNKDSLQRKGIDSSVPKTSRQGSSTVTAQAASHKHSARPTGEDQPTLSPRQFQIMKQAGPQALIHGPPKTGKTRRLIHIAKMQLNLGVPVVILSTWDGSLASSRLIQRQAKTPKGKEAKFIHSVLYDDAVGEVVEKVAAFARDSKLCVIADEAHDGPAFETLCNELHKKIPNVHIWAAASKHKHVPAQMTKELLTEPQGNQAPHIQQLMGRAGFFRDGSTENYTGTVTDASEAVTTKMSTRSTVELSQGDPDKQLPHQGTGHDALEPKNCEQCGKDIATALGELGVNSKEDDGTSKYSFKDVFVLLRRDTDPADTDGQHNDIGVVRGLRSSGIPVRVVGRDDEDGVAEMVTIQEKDEGEVTVATILHARGLERKIVVWVGVGEGDYYDVYDKYHATSRAMEKVVWVKAPYEIDFDDAVRNDSDDDEDA